MRFGEVNKVGKKTSANKKDFIGKKPKMKYFPIDGYMDRQDASVFIPLRDDQT
jgi:hypothetical protein